MKIALCNHRGVHGTDLRNPQLGNPGVGGAEYQYAMLAYALVNFSDCEVSFYSMEENCLFPDGVKVRSFRDNSDLSEQLRADGTDIAVD